jgi:hypothetical protein
MDTWTALNMLLNIPGQKMYDVTSLAAVNNHVTHWSWPTILKLPWRLYFWHAHMQTHRHSCRILISVHSLNCKVYQNDLELKEDPLCWLCGHFKDKNCKLSSCMLVLSECWPMHITKSKICASCYCVRQQRATYCKYIVATLMCFSPPVTV